MNAETFNRLAIPGTIQARLDKELRDELNESLHFFLPENIDLETIDPEELDEQKITKSTIVNELVRVALSKAKATGTNKETTKRLAELEAEVNRLNEELTEATTAAQIAEQQIERFQQEAQEAQRLLNHNARIIDELTREKEQLAQSSNQLKAVLTDERRIEITLNKYQLLIVKEYLYRLSTRLKKEITASQLFFNLFWRYITKQETELGEFIFVLSPSEIKKILQEAKTAEAQETNPQN